MEAQSSRIVAESKPEMDQVQDEREQELTPLDLAVPKKKKKNRKPKSKSGKVTSTIITYLLSTSLTQD